MRIYSDVLEAVKEIERDLVEMGIYNHSDSVQDLNVKEDQDYDSKELQGYCYCITGFEDVHKIFGFFFEGEELERVINYSRVERKERLILGARNPGDSWKERPEYWEKFLHWNKFQYTYNERMWWQLGKIIEELRRSKGSRQCIISIFDPCKDFYGIGGKVRIPCSMYYQFMIRNISGKDRLIMIYTMRSQDFYTHFAIDVWLAIELGKYIAKVLGIELYSFTHFIGSLHAFRRDYENRRVF